MLGLIEQPFKGWWPIWESFHTGETTICRISSRTRRPCLEALPWLVRLLKWEFAIYAAWETQSLSFFRH